jgi:hypothetical protein
MSTTKPAEKQYTLEEKRELFYAIEAAAKAASSPWAMNTDIDASRAMRYLKQFINGVKPAPEFTEDVASISQAMHTYLRKYTDSHLETLIYVLVSNNEGMGVWHALCKAVHEHKDDKKQNIYDYTRAIEIYARNNDELPENQTMSLALRAWLDVRDGKDFLLMLKTFKDDGWI